MKIGVVGGGTVGRAVARTYLEFVDEVRVYDVVPELCTHPVESHGHGPEIPALNCDVVFVCLPEEAVGRFFSELNTYVDKPLQSGINFVLKSTVPVGTTRRLRDRYGLVNFVHSPEFLTARCAETDARVPAVNIIGTPHGSPIVPWSGMPLNELYKRRFPGTQIIQMSSDESEAVKLMINSAFAVKVALFNEFHAYCEATGLDWETVRAGILADGRITAHHTKVPGPDGKCGFGGACLPKDLKTLVEQIAAAGCAVWVTQGAETRNRRLDRPREVK
jgi:UDP-glucose 6-dehydrogenase